MLIPGDNLPGTFDGEKVSEVINVIVKLKTMSNQPEVEIGAGLYWWIDPHHLIQAVRYWKKRNHPCLKGIRFPDITHSSWSNLWNKERRKKEEETVIRKWKHLTTKPYNLLARYHKNFLEENDIEDEDDLEIKFSLQRQGFEM